MLVVSAHLHGTLFTMQMNKKGSFQRAKGKMAASTCRGRTDWQEGIISTKPGLHVPNRWHAVRTQFQLFMSQLETDIQGFANLAQSPKIIKCHTWFNFPFSFSESACNEWDLWLDLDTWLFGSCFYLSLKVVGHQRDHTGNGWTACISLSFLTTQNVWRIL